MSDDLSPSQPADAQQPRSFRWRLIPASALCVIGLSEVLAAVGMALFAIFYNLQRGWIVVDPVDPRATPWALCPFNLTLWQIHFWMGVVAVISAWAWLRGRWFIAWGTLAAIPLFPLLLRTVFTWHDKIR